MGEREQPWAPTYRSALARLRKPLRQRHPAERLATSAVELGGDRVEMPLGETAEIAALGEVVLAPAKPTLLSDPRRRLAMPSKSAQLD